METAQIINHVIGLMAVFAPVAYAAHRANCQHRKDERLTELDKEFWELMSIKVEESGKSLMDMLSGCKEDQNPGRIPSTQRQRLIGFFKKVDILMRKGAVDKGHVFNLFAQHAIQCYANEHFWKGLDKNSIYLESFRNFVEDMRQVEQKERMRVAQAN